MYVRDTIAAVSTPPGSGGIGIVRISGAQAAAIGKAVFKPIHDGGLVSHRFAFGRIFDQNSGDIIDEAMAVLMCAPRSYTREDVLELHCHGGWLVVERVLSLALLCGARLADPGEFTRRAFLNGRIDLIQAEAVMDIIASRSEAALKLAQQQREGLLSRSIEKIRSYLIQSLALVEAYIDFPDDDIGDTDLAAIRKSVHESLSDTGTLLASFDQGRVVRDGVSVLIIGKPNVGKSSLLNCLLNENRAIVTHIPGTTRDIIEETVLFNGLAVRLLDSAGIRQTHDVVETEGIKRTLEKIPSADLVLFVMDTSSPFSAEDQLILDAVAGFAVMAVFNKCDLPRTLVVPDGSSFNAQVSITALSGDGIAALKNAVSGYFMVDAERDTRDIVALSRARHRDALVSTEQSLLRTDDLLTDGHLELMAVELRDALAAVGSVTGQTTPDDILDAIFSSFCIGK
ncbi:MAG TPA: tRNA uridine-5-carboxymethylaminomethyl(34) synthesis GTPase MnmE [Desulfuromonadales bacterium]|nr:tRNA uridine-5-carboxymethylaminomethyl(34) synthesis GTPase MnmE [Desulfuromonadales bacterium]